MRRRIDSNRDAISGHRAAAGSPGLRVALLWIYIVAVLFVTVLFVLGCAAQAESVALHHARPSPSRVRRQQGYETAQADYLRTCLPNDGNTRLDPLGLAAGIVLRYSMGR
jgi:hypothetical protein